MEAAAITGSIWIIKLTAEFAEFISVLHRIALVALFALVIKIWVVWIVPAENTFLVEEIGRAVQWFFGNVVPGHGCFRWGVCELEADVFIRSLSKSRTSR